jgi:hypothetical protein
MNNSRISHPILLRASRVLKALSPFLHLSFLYPSHFTYHAPLEQDPGLSDLLSRSLSQLGPRHTTPRSLALPPERLGERVGRVLGPLDSQHPQPPRWSFRRILRHGSGGECHWVRRYRQGQQLLSLSNAALPERQLGVVSQGIPAYLRFYRDFSVADFTFCTISTVFVTYASFSYYSIRSMICEELSRHGDLMRDLAEIGLSSENCEQWFERGVMVFVGVMFIIIVLRVSEKCENRKMFRF